MPDLTRRNALRTATLGGTAAALAAAPSLARAAATQPDTPSTPGTTPAGQHLPENNPYAHLLRDTSGDEWRAKMAPGSTLAKAYEDWERIEPDKPLPPGRPGVDYTPVVTPNNGSLPFEIRDGVKVFHLIAEEVQHRFAEGLEAYTWGYNGVTQGPTIEAVEGERVRIYVTNRLPAPTTVHWHGFILPHGMDGVSGLEQAPILPGETFKYEWTIRQNGTFMYHSHHDTMTQEGMGLTGMFIVHPRRELYPASGPGALGPEVDRDFAIMLQTWFMPPGTHRPDPFSMMFNLFTMNAHVMPDTEPLVARLGQRVRIRFGNLSAVHHHPIHLHGYEFAVTAEDGRRIPPEDQDIQATIFVPVGRTKDIELVGIYEGDWVFHCHMTHHIMTQMMHFTNTVGMNPAGLDEKVQELLPDFMTMGNAGMNDRTGRPMHPIPENSRPMYKGMGPYGKVSVAGMANLLKIRRNVTDEMLANNTDPGMYRGPRATQALPVSPEEMRAAGLTTERLASR
ncbi:multicopper oxidase family protein [Phycisphaera mikurensis]|uniref:Putative multicopper oxidase n=1 Tax=Phycisphaera mikurensis (strain NBRC 102666 / KCTC 22515 / FYK2301M01) TaxID=1142394 RepID=I0IGL5_PHYMF|nr:copper oxidase [Phycisphaera mikurensis]MBB6442915.1 FtsP/CotA-like multicopper oxidase with cupredoxin domain [Phycisphaera mikurensis]BAM04403.1 putative multicopper oxidase [Phycisphaera mikurensis NBRC 102666]